MKKLLFLFIYVFALAPFASAQLGGQHMVRMNSLLQQYGGDNTPKIQYEVKYGLAEQEWQGYTDRFTISNIEKIEVQKAEGGFFVSLLCASSDPCISHIDPQYNSSYQSAINYFLNDEDAANLFAKLAGEIIAQDFKKKIDLKFTKEPPTIKEVAIQKKEPSSKQSAQTKPAKNKDHLSLKNYSEQGNVDADKSLNAFGKQLMRIVDHAEKNELDQIAGATSEGARASKVKLPKAKRNYINEYKGAACFIAEFETKKYYEDLIDLYQDIKDDIERALPIEYEPRDMAYEAIYDNSDDEVYHTEYYHEDSSKPSIVIRITPDGKENTLFLRVGKR